MKVVDNVVENKDPESRVCWKGGLEGLRKKGWSVLNILVIERAGRQRNTEIKILAQGDNQVLCTFYKLVETHTEDAFKEHINEIQYDNEKSWTLLENLHWPLD